jgi:hypothetical protein
MLISITIAVRTSLLTFTSLKRCANERLCFQQYGIYIWQRTSTDVRLHDSAFNITTWRLEQKTSTMKEIRSRYDTVCCGHVNEPLCVIKTLLLSEGQTALHALNIAECVCIVLTSLYDTRSNAAGRCIIY